MSTIITHPVTGQSVAEVALELLKATLKARSADPDAYAGLSTHQHARQDAELLARHAKTPELQQFYAAVAASLRED